MDFQLTEDPRAFADMAQSGRLVIEANHDSTAAREIAALAAEVRRLAP